MLNKNPSSKRKTLTTPILLTLLISALAGSLFVNLAAANPRFDYLYYPGSPPPNPIVKVTWLNTDKLTLTFSVQKSGSWIDSYGAEGFGDYEPYHVYEYSISSIIVWVDGKSWSRHIWGPRPISVSLEGLSNGWHTLEVTAATREYSASQGSSGVIEFQVDNPPPSVQIQSLKNTAINEGYFQFALRVYGRTLSWVGYSIDGKENVTVNQGSLTSYAKAWTGNLTLTGLPVGSHSLVVYAKDQAGNTGASTTKKFTVEESAAAKEAQAASLPITLTATAILASTALISFSLVAYFVKRRRRRTT